MRTENFSEISREVIEISAFYKSLAQNLVANFNSKTGHNLFIEIDCVPCVGLNAFHVGNGFNSAKIIYELNQALETGDNKLLNEKIGIVKDNSWMPSYSLGENLGLWKQVKENDYEEFLDWSKPFCMKNTRGITKIWHPCSRKVFKTGFATRSSIVKFIKEEVVYMQPFYTPLSLKNNRLWHTIYRLVFFSNGQDEPEFVGGFSISRQGFKIYPGNGSIVGLIR